MRLRKSRLALALAACIACAHHADAHVQITPTEAAPGDDVQFELLVPNEEAAHTIEVALRVPEGVLPFSYEREPGWHRQLDKRDGRVAVIRWHGDLARGAFVRFSFLASTPDREGELVWKTVQRYDDGAESEWIGAPGSEEPAPVTRLSASLAPRATEAAENEDGGSGLALVLGAAGLVVAAAALFFALRRRTRPDTRAEAW